jgi:small multidrug resistance pump
MKQWIFLSIAICFEVIGTSALKVSHGFTHKLPTILSLSAFLVSLLFLSMALKSIPVGIAYAIWSGIGIILISIIGYFAFKQSLDFAAVLGMVFIILGVIIINLCSSSITH